MNLEAILKKYYQLSAFRGGQKETIESILNKRHTLAMLPTGTGKSLCYQLAGKLLEGTVIIISPLLSLMQDQVEQMKMKGEKRVVALNSFLNPTEKNKVLRQIKQYKYIFISPEMISFPHIIDQLQKMEISLFVIDEAHCISQWGYDFRPDYQKLGEIRQKLNNPLTLALTATATEAVREDIIKSLHLEMVEEIIYSVDRANIAINIEEVSHVQEKVDKLLEYIQRLDGQGIVYFSSKKLAEQTVAFLKEKSSKRIMAYHGGMTQEDRILVQQQFLAGQLDVICATSAFGMGINKEDIRFIIHYHLPTQLESYLQEIGRAGRDGNPSVSIILYTPGDEWIAYQLIESELADELQINQWKARLKNFPSFEAWQKKEGYQLEMLFTETQWRVLESYIEPNNKTISELLHSLKLYNDFRENRVNEKRRKVQDLMEWLHSISCRRRYILEYFGEKYESKENENCCDRCGIELSNFYHKKSMEDDEVLVDWKSQLAFILNIKK
ncbi:ATP-dependent DNA helicase [Niallia circulans]|uniref:RecQ family ATP-dependent DNA helicase n=1 Tax=Niallia circulans TaxID=1397 RepID=UPI000F452F1A|nr:ATP-dependent DNA helicase RecQ [Niallia circulans]AYV66893.1 ATP-dependent DNA helicase [Niallia circulans]